MSDEMLSIIGKVKFPQGERVAVLNPQDDMTPVESVYMANMFAVAARGYANVNWFEYINERNIGRHFKVEDLQPDIKED